MKSVFIVTINYWDVDLVQILMTQILNMKCFATILVGLPLSVTYVMKHVWVLRYFSVRSVAYMYKCKGVANIIVLTHCVLQVTGGSRLSISVLTSRHMLKTMPSSEH